MMAMYLTQGLHRALQQVPHNTATIYGERRHNFREFVERIGRFAGVLQSLGMSNNDRIAILSLNSDRYIEYLYGVWWGGGVVNPINSRWNDLEIAYSLDDCDCRILIVDDNFVSLVDKLLTMTKSLQTVIYAGDNDNSNGLLSYEKLIGETQPVEDKLRTNDDLAGIFYTGGTTGYPKGVMVTHTNLISSVIAICAEGVAREHSVGLHAMPMFHISDITYIIAQFVRPCTHVIVPAFQVEMVLKTIQDKHVNSVLLVPTMLQMMVDSSDFENYNLSTLDQIFYAASPINEALLKRAMAKMPHVSFTQLYGMTEMSPLISILPPNYHIHGSSTAGKLRSAGRASLTVEVRIVDENGNDAPSGKVGEIVARGAGLMKGYWNQPEWTSDVIRDGWMHTGDCAYMDDDGYIYIVDRLKDMIVSGGENIYSAEVENALSQHPAVELCAVIGIPNNKWGESVHAFIVLTSGQEVTVEEIQNHCKTLIAGYKCPRSIEFVDVLPLSSTGKILKSKLRELYQGNHTSLTD